MRKFIALSALAITLGAGAQNQDVTINSTELAEGVWMLEGRGGNLMLVAGEDGSFLVDDQLAPLTELIQAKIAELGAADVEFILNTHYHGDHTGGNENFGEAGALLVAHDNVRTRMALDFHDEMFDRRHEPVDPAALPVITFSESMRFHRYGHEVHVFHIAHAHTDGDSAVHLPGVNVLHTGDVFFNGLYPFIDSSGGGSVAGTLAAVDQALALCDENTKIVPGHGPLADRADLLVYRDMLVDVRAKVRAAIDEGKSLDETVALKLTAEYDDVWGKTWLDGDQFTRGVYLSETKHP